MGFSILTINTKDLQPSLPVMTERILEAFKTVFPMVPIDYTDFKKNTESKEIPLYIMENREGGGFGDMQSMEAIKKVMNPHHMFSVKAPLDQTVNPRYGILDIHSDRPGDNKMYHVRIILSKDVPVSYAKILSELVHAIDKPFRYRIMSIEQHIGGLLEIYQEYEWNNIMINEVGTKENRIIERHIPIRAVEDHPEIDTFNTLIGRLDSNIDVEMAPRDLADMEAALAAYKSSKEFMEKAGLNSTQEYFEVNTDIKEAEARIAEVRQLIVKPEAVRSIYFRITDPRSLKKYAIQPIQVQGRSQERWN